MARENSPDANGSCQVTRSLEPRRDGFESQERAWNYPWRRCTRFLALNGARVGAE